MKGLTSFGEAHLEDGTLVSFRCPSDQTEKVKEFLESLVCELSFPETHRINVGHGGYGQYSRYEIVSHKYAGGGHPGCGGYFEVLEIKNPPDNRCGFVLHEYRSDSGTRFIEWESLEDAINGFEMFWGGDPASLKELSGFIRIVECGLLAPWFYAVGTQELVGDYVLPEGLQDDLLFTIGRRFIVCVDTMASTGKRDKENNQIYTQFFETKTCLGCKVIIPKEDENKRPRRIAFFHDGTYWDSEYPRGFPIPRPIEDHPGMGEALRNFTSLILQQKGSFELRLPGGLVVSAKMRQESLGEYS